jgi:murein DD-endopeptidase MepM/ murein hydrolase activator NlpD
MLPTIKKIAAITATASTAMLIAFPALADTFSINGIALNTNNLFPKTDGFPGLFTYALNSTDPDQQFDIIPGSSGVLLKHKSTGRCVNAHYLNNGGKVNIYTCLATDPDQNWKINSLGNGVASIQRAGTDWCATMPVQAANQQIVLGNCNGSAGQKFTVNAGSTAPPTNNSANTPYLPFTTGVTATVTQGYEAHKNGIFPKYNQFAIDFAPPTGYDVAARAVRTGTVLYAGADVNNDQFGNRVLIKYNDGRIGFYAHLKSVDVTANSIVAGGQRLGIIGNTGTASRGVHLHYAEGTTREGNYVMNQLPVNFTDAPNANFTQSGFIVTSSNPDNRR